MTIVPAEHHEIWPTLATTIAESDPELKKRREVMRKHLRPTIEEVQRAIVAFPDQLSGALAPRLAQLGATSTRGPDELIRVFEDLGLPIPAAVTGAPGP